MCDLPLQVLSLPVHASLCPAQLHQFFDLGQVFKCVKNHWSSWRKEKIIYLSNMLECISCVPGLCLHGGLSRRVMMLWVTEGGGAGSPWQGGGLTVNLILKPSQCIRRGFLRTHAGGGLQGVSRQRK